MSNTDTNLLVAGNNPLAQNEGTTYVVGEPDLQSLGLGVPWEGPTNNAINADVGANSVPSISPLPGLPGSTLSGGIQSGGSTLGSGGSLNVAPTSQTTATTPAATSTPPASTAAPAATTSSGPATGSIADYFARAVIIILGMIFVAIGLHMLAPSVVPDVRRVGR